MVRPNNVSQHRFLESSNDLHLPPHWYAKYDLEFSLIPCGAVNTDTLALSLLLHFSIIDDEILCPSFPYKSHLTVTSENERGRSVTVYQRSSFISFTMLSGPRSPSCLGLRSNLGHHRAL